jgi:hypothetical protein
MALTRGSLIGYDTELMMFKFTMMARDARIVECLISSVAMDRMDGRRGTLPSEREAQFMRHRDIIDKVASDSFEERGSMPDAVLRIFEKDLPPEIRARKSRQ